MTMVRHSSGVRRLSGVTNGSSVFIVDFELVNAGWKEADNVVFFY